MASVKKVGKVWRCWVSKTPKGADKPVRDTGTFDNKAEAVAWGQRREDEILAGDRPDGQTLHRAFQRFSDEECPKRKGKRWEQVRLAKFIKDIPDKRLHDMNGSELAEWRNKRLGEVAGASVRREMNLIQAVLEMARKEWKWMSHQPMKDISRPANPPSRRRLITEGEISLLLESLVWREKITAQDSYVAAAFLFALETAMRASEILSIAPVLINAQARTVMLPATKNGDVRLVPLSRRALEILEIVGGQFRISPQALDVRFRSARERAGLSGFTFHDSRATALTRLAKKLDVMELARMVGHRDPRSLMIYYAEPASEIAKKLD